ncbi:MAG: hypothetical protein L3J71_06955 [Victivallaceae bacterium]|nr:hypothetical protein [Victivallaceae bacterium]
MKRSIISAILNILILLALVSCSVFGILYLYESSEFFQSLFSNAPTLLPSDKELSMSASELAAGNRQLYGKISLYLFSAIVAIQVASFYIALTVVRSIKKSIGDIKLKLKKLDNADIFLDLPLYVGLFGTVAAFIVMSFNPITSRLIAYSSTLIGVVISVLLRTIILFPYRQKLLSEKNN